MGSSATTRRDLSHTEQLVQQAAAGDQAALERLLASHRDRLRRMAGVRLDRRIASRVDPSDIVQEALADAARKFNDYARERTIPFYAWLRQLAWERVIQAHRRHLYHQGRSVLREDPLFGQVSQHSTKLLARMLQERQLSPSERVMHEERKRRVQDALERLSPRHREVLVLRYLEQLSSEEIGAVLGLSREGVKSRLRRALERFSLLVHENLRE